MKKADLIELQKLDCNCNDCVYMERDFDEFDKWNSWYKGREKCSYRINYGNCSKFNKPVSFIPNICQLKTQECFKHRKTKTYEQETLAI